MYNKTKTCLQLEVHRSMVSMVTRTDSESIQQPKSYLADFHIHQNFKLIKLKYMMSYPEFFVNYLSYSKET